MFATFMSLLIFVSYHYLHYADIPLEIASKSVDLFTNSTVISNVTNLEIEE